MNEERLSFDDAWERWGKYGLPLVVRNHKDNEGVLHLVDKNTKSIRFEVGEEVHEGLWNYPVNIMIVDTFPIVETCSCSVSTIREKGRCQCGYINFYVDSLRINGEE